jgi:alanine dehydrogenase
VAQDQVLLISDKEVKNLLSMDETIDAVEEAFRAKGLGKTQMPPKSYLFFDGYQGDVRIMPSYLESIDSAGVKIVSVHPNNPTRFGIPTVMGIITLIDPRTGAVTAIVDGTYITSMRTGAAGAVATKHLARKNSGKLGLVGAGVQARTQLQAISRVLDLEKVYVWSIPESTIDSFIHTEQKNYDFQFVHCKSCEDCVSKSDVISTVTPSSNPIINSEWVTAGTHINAMGADAPGKEELDPQLLLKSKVVVDDMTQAVHSGEINVPISMNLFSESRLYCELSDIITGKKIGRNADDEITIFDSTGLSLLDVSTATLV